MRLEDVKVGMKVRVIGTLMSNTDGWNNSWVPEMDAGVGHTFEVLSVCPFARGIILRKISPKLGHNPLDDWIFPWQVLEPVVENKAHPHAALMAQYAEDAKVKDRPWELWQYNDIGTWDDLGCNPAWCTNTQYRRKPSKPKTIKIGEFDVPAPETERLVKGTVYYYPSLTTEANYASTRASTRWDNDDFDQRLLKRGLVHLTKEAAIAHTKALLSLTITQIQHQHLVGDAMTDMNNTIELPEPDGFLEHGAIVTFLSYTRNASNDTNPIQRHHPM